MENTTTTQRRDIHRPKELVTEDYEYVFAIDNQSPWALGLAEDFLRELMNFTDELGDRGTSQCHHCGAHIRYAAFLRHLPTGKTIVVGETCLDNRFSLATSEFHRLRKLAQLDRERQRIKTEISAFCEANPDLGWMANDPAENSWPRDARDNSFIADVARKLRRYGSLSDRQVEAVRKSMERERRWRDDKATEVWVPIPEEGRVRITGTVLSTRWQDNAYGGTMKMLLKVDSPSGGHYKLWGSVPGSLSVTKDDRVALTARIERSKDDESFGFYRLDSGHRAELLEEEK